MFKKNYNFKKTISIKQFISEFGENFSDHMKQKLMELEVRSVLTRESSKNILDLKHVEHTEFDYKCDDSKNQKREYAYGEFVVIDNILYFSEKCTKNLTVMQSPIVDKIYSSLSTDNSIVSEDTLLKRIDNSNIDYVINTILTVCPQVSKRYMDILKHMSSY